MARYQILTNNPRVYEHYQQVSVFVDASATEVLVKARNEIHQGATLISHPLSGNVRPGLNPYKSVVISERKPQLDFQSLKLIEEAMILYRKNGTIKYKAYNEYWVNDFQTVDMDLVFSAIAGLPPDLE